MWVLESNGLVASEQCSFRRRKHLSNADYLLHFDGYIRNAKKEHVLVIFFDLEKAYDTMWKRVFCLT